VTWSARRMQPIASAGSHERCHVYTLRDPFRRLKHACMHHVKKKANSRHAFYVLVHSSSRMLACLCPGSFLLLRILPLSSVSKYSCYFAKKKGVSTPSYTKYELMNRIGSECSGQCPPSYEAELERLYRRAQTKRFFTRRRGAYACVHVHRGS
jgi:hypothetical protein